MRLLLLFLLPLLGLSAADAPDREEIVRLIKQLGSDDFDHREEASRKLEQAGEEALAPLQQAAKSSDAEVRRRAVQLVEIIENKLYGIIRVFAGHTSEVWAVAVSPDGKRLLTG